MTAGSIVEVGMHLAAGTVAAAAAVVVRLAPEGQRRALRYLGCAALGSAVWALSVALYLASGTHPWTMAWFPSIAFTAGALALWAGSFTRYEWTPDRWLISAWIGVPLAMLAVRIAWGPDAVIVLFVFNTIYCFSLLLVAAALISSRASDPNPSVRAAARAVLVIAAVILISEAFRLNVSDIAVAAVVATIAVAARRAGDAFPPRPSADLLLDDLGALVLVFDDAQRLADLNAPARLFYTLRRAEPPPVGTRASALLGSELPGLDVITVGLSAGSDTVRFSGYVQRLPYGGSPPRGWICLLRRSTGAPSHDDRREARRALMNRLPTHDPTTGLLTERAFEQAISSAAEFLGAERIQIVVLQVQVPDATTLETTASSLAQAWEGRIESIALGRLGELRLGLVVRDLPESMVLAQTMEGDAVTGRTASSAGALARVHDLLAEASARLAV